jgi:hypothetical protein
MWMCRRLECKNSMLKVLLIYGDNKEFRFASFEIYHRIMCPDWNEIATMLREILTLKSVRKAETFQPAMIDIQVG